MEKWYLALDICVMYFETHPPPEKREKKCHDNRILLMSQTPHNIPTPNETQHFGIRWPLISKNAFEVGWLLG